MQKLTKLKIFNVKNLTQVPSCKSAVDETPDVPSYDERAYFHYFDCKKS